MPFMQQRADQQSDIKMQMDKFIRQIQTSLQQAYGNVTIDTPEVPDKPPDELCNN